MKKKLFSFCLLITTLSVFSRDYIITEHGVATDSTKISTAAIQSVINKAESDGGGIIVIPKGVYLSGALFFKSNTKLRLEEGAVLKGSDDIADYPLIPSRMEGQNILYYAALINAYYINNFSITGSGTVNGNGHKFWNTFWLHRETMNNAAKPWTNLEVYRPRLIFIWGCDNINIQNVKLRNAGFWTIHLYQCNNVMIDGCDIRSPFAPVAAPSTDGIDIDFCKKVTIRNCYIAVNDDAIAIKGGKGPDAHKQTHNGIVEDMLIENCTFGASHGVLTMGSECIHARNIVMRNCKVENKTSLLRLKMRPDTYQIYENITIDGITGTCGTLISLVPWTQFFNLKGSVEKPFGTVRNITFSNINVKCNRLGNIKGNSTDTISAILFKDMKITASKASLESIYKDITFDNVTVNGTPFEIK